MTTYWGDVAQPVRRAAVPFFGRLLAEVNDSLGTDFYVETETYHREFVGFVNRGSEDLEDYMVSEMGFTYNALSSWKTLVSNSDAYEQTSLAWRGTIEDGSFERDEQADMQLHVVFYELDGDSGTTAVFAHWEYSWKTHPIKHYRGTDASAEMGVSITRQMFRDHGIDVFDEDYFA